MSNGGRIMLFKTFDTSLILQQYMTAFPILDEKLRNQLSPATQFEIPDRSGLLAAIFFTKPVKMNQGKPTCAGFQRALQKLLVALQCFFYKC